MKVAALDLGSNTFLLLIAEVEGGEIRQVIHDEVRVTRLGQGVHHTKEFHPEALLRVRQCLSDYRRIIDQHQVAKTWAVATSAARDVKNRQEFFGICEDLRIPVKVLTGAEEAQITFLGATSGLSDSAGLAVIDVGGGSTEVIGHVSEGLRGLSLDLGSVRLTEMFLPEHPCSRRSLEDLDRYVQRVLSDNRAELPPSPRAVMAVAGTPTTLATLKLGRTFDAQLVEGQVLTASEILDWRDRLADMTVAAREALPGMAAGRADVLVAGATILARAIEALGTESVTVSTRGVRHGVARAMVNWS